MPPRFWPPTTSSRWPINWTFWLPTYTYCCDFLSLWGLFAIFVVLFRAVTDQFSKVKVRFPAKIDQVGGIVVSVVIGWVMVCFTLTTLHTAPLGEKFLFGSFQAGEPMFLGIMSPDAQWLRFMQATSKGALGRSVGEPGQKPEMAVFDPGREFQVKYNFCRKDFGAHMKKTGSIRLDVANGEKRAVYQLPPAAPPKPAPAPSEKK